MKKELLKLSLAAMMVGMTVPAQANDFGKMMTETMVDATEDYIVPAAEATAEIIANNKYSLEAQMFFYESLLMAYESGYSVGEWQTHFPLELELPEEYKTYGKIGVIGAEAALLAYPTYKGMKWTNKTLTAVLNRSNPNLVQIRDVKAQRAAAVADLKAIARADKEARAAQQAVIAGLDQRIKDLRLGAPSLLKRGAKLGIRTVRRVAVAGVFVAGYAAFTTGNSAALFFGEDFTLIKDLLENKIKEIELQLILIEGEKDSE